MNLLARVVEVFPLACPVCGGGIWLISFIDLVEAELGNSDARGRVYCVAGHFIRPGAPVFWGDPVQADDASDLHRSSPDEF